MDIKEVLLLWFVNFFLKEYPGSGVNNKIKQNQQLVEELHKPITRKFLKEFILL